MIPKKDYKPFGGKDISIVIRDKNPAEHGMIMCLMGFTIMCAIAASAFLSIIVRALMYVFTGNWLFSACENADIISRNKINTRAESCQWKSDFVGFEKISNYLYNSVDVSIFLTAVAVLVFVLVMAFAFIYIILFSLFQRYLDGSADRKTR